MVELDFQDQELKIVIDTIGRATGRNFVYGDEVRGRMSLITPRPLPLATAYVVFESSLLAAGFKVVEQPDGAFEIVPVSRAKPRSRAVPRRMRSPADIFSEARILPEWEDGRMVGIRVSGIQPGSLFKEMGVKNGEVITQLNGIVIDSPEASAEVMLELTEADTFDVTIEGPNGQRILRVSEDRSVRPRIGSR